MHEGRSELIWTKVSVWANNKMFDGSNYLPKVKSQYKICRSKADPLQAWSGIEGSRKLRFLDFMTTAREGGKFVRLTHRRPLPPGNTPGTHFC
jgi:hypothetical protein